MDGRSDRNIRDRLVAEAGYALWLLVVKREARSLAKIDHVMQEYDLPNQVSVPMGPLASRASVRIWLR
jgi:hypothetical protein